MGNSEIYQDSANNFFLGDCRWGVMDGNYPTSNWMRSFTHKRSWGQLSKDLSNLFEAVGYADISVREERNNAYNQMLFRFSPKIAGELGLISEVSWGINSSATGGNFNWPYRSRLLNGQIYSEDGSGVFYDTLCYLCFAPTYPENQTTFVRYVACASENSLGLFVYNDNFNKTSFNTDPVFYYWGLAEEINPLLYETFPLSSIPIQVHLRISYAASSTYTIPFELTRRYGYMVHNEFGRLNSSSILEGGAGNYLIECENGDEVTEQWATDFIIYEKNRLLANGITEVNLPIGKVPNLLLGIGNYTFMKPVKIIGGDGSGGSPWFLPVGTFGDKTLLMRCWSSQTYF